MVEGYAGFGRLLKAGCIAYLASAERSGDFLCKGLVFSEFVEDGFMQKVLDVFGVVEGRRGSRCLGCFLLVARLAGVYAFVDTQAAKIWERYLEFADRLGAGYEVFCLARRALEDLLALRTAI